MNKEKWKIELCTVPGGNVLPKMQLQHSESHNQPRTGQQSLCSPQ